MLIACDLPFLLDNWPLILPSLDLNRLLGVFVHDHSMIGYCWEWPSLYFALGWDRKGHFSSLRLFLCLFSGCSAHYWAVTIERSCQLLDDRRSAIDNALTGAAGWYDGSNLGHCDLDYILANRLHSLNSAEIWIYRWHDWWEMEHLLINRWRLSGTLIQLVEQITVQRVFPKWWLIVAERSVGSIFLLLYLSSRQQGGEGFLLALLHLTTNTRSFVIFSDLFCLLMLCERSEIDCRWPDFRSSIWFKLLQVKWVRH